MSLLPAPMDHEPQCRYNHGALERVSEPGMGGTGPTEYFMSLGVGRSRRGNYLRQTGGNFIYQIWRCPVCGYLESYDRDPP